MDETTFQPKLPIQEESNDSNDVVAHRGAADDFMVIPAFGVTEVISGMRTDKQLLLQK